MAIRRVIRLMDETTIHASDDAMEASQALARRRHRLSHARVRSTIQRRGRVIKPVRSDRLMCRSCKPRRRSSCCRSPSSSDTVAHQHHLGADVASMAQHPLPGGCQSSRPRPPPARREARVGRGPSRNHAQRCVPRFLHSQLPARRPHKAGKLLIKIDKNQGGCQNTMH